MKYYDELLKLTLSVTEDKVWAYLTGENNRIDPGISERAIRSFLEKNGVVSCINQTAVEGLYESGCDAEVLIAKGQYPIDGTDSKMTYLFELEHHAKPHSNTDGTIDFKELGYVDMVEEGTLLIKKTEATEGVDGMNVEGKVLKAMSGKDQKIKYGKNCRLSEDGLELYAAVDGAILMEEGCVSIEQVIEINENVGTATGNIHFDGEVVVHGDILEGMTVTCRKLVVDGVIEGSDITVDGDIIVGKGVNGRKQAHILSKGNLVCKYINNAVVVADGDLEADAILNSEVRCGHHINVNGRNGCIIGGHIFAADGIDAKVIGSELGVATEVKVGDYTDLIETINKTRARIEELDVIDEKTVQCLTILAQKVASQPENGKYKELLERYDENRDAVADEKAKLEREMKVLTSQLSHRSDAHVKAGDVFPDVHIVMGHERKDIMDHEHAFEVHTHHVDGEACGWLPSKSK